MIAVKGYYRDGKITLLEPLPESVREAQLNIIVLPAEQEGYVSPPAGEYLVRESTSEEEFKALGCAPFSEPKTMPMWIGRMRCRW